MRTGFLVFLAAGILAVGPAAARPGGAHGHHGHHHHLRGLPYGYRGQPPVRPQFNDPGPPVALPQPGNPVEQLSPLQSTNPGFWSGH